MAESQAVQESTQVAARSQSQPEATLPSAHSHQQADRQAQEAAKTSVEDRNPYSAKNIAAKKAKMMEALRSERGVPAPKEAANANASGATGDVPGEHISSASESGGESNQRKAGPQAAAAPTEISAAQTEWYKREQAAQALEQKAKETTSVAERRIAEAEAKEARAAEKLQKMEWAMQSPVEYMAEAGMTQEQWSDFLANGGKLSPEQKRVRELEKRLHDTVLRMEATEKQNVAAQAQARMHMENAQFSAQMKDYTFLPQMGGVESARQHQRFLEGQLKQPVSLKDAADNLEKDLQGRLSGLLKHDSILSKLGLAANVNQPKAAPTGQSPRTLNAKVSSETSATDPTVKGPLDWKGKRALYLQRVEQERKGFSGR